MEYILYTIYFSSLTFLSEWLPNDLVNFIYKNLQLYVQKAIIYNFPRPIL